MPSDAVMVALIKQATVAHNEDRRKAARLVLDMLRSTQGFGDLPRTLESIRAEDGPDVAAEMHTLIDQYGLGGPSDLLR